MSDRSTAGGGISNKEQGMSNDEGNGIISQCADGLMKGERMFNAQFSMLNTHWKKKEKEGLGIGSACL
jgi:hypothetical protein